MSSKKQKSLRIINTEKLFTCFVPHRKRGGHEKNSIKLDVPIKIPFTTSVNECVHLIITSFELPTFLFEDIKQDLESFISVETPLYLNSLSEARIRNAIEGKLDTEEIIRRLEHSYKTETLTYAPPEEVSNELVFSEAYNSLVHSPVLEAILHIEQMYGQAVQELIEQENEEVDALTKSQASEMSSAVHEANETNDNEKVNRLAARQFEDHHLLHIEWSSRLEALKESQKKNYCDWIMKAHEDYYTMKTMPALSDRLSKMKRNGVLEPPEPLPIPQLEESFTIHLGSQMKQMYNIRLMAGDPLDFCMHKSNNNKQSTESNPQHLQTAISLYSNDLSGIVLLVDDTVTPYTGLNKDFHNICQQSSEFHFTSYESQLETIKSQLPKAIEWRESCPARLDVDDLSGGLNKYSKSFHEGDCYITKHSNLANVHVAFHLVITDSLKSGDINSRHPVILGLRNILKTACLNDVTTIFIPALLTHELSENMTVAWCTKRAELVYKCVKGFMIEMASWGGTELKNLQFLVPKGISEEVFNSLAVMLPSIFRISNPLRLKSGH